jgi:hypothetical protein
MKHFLAIALLAGTAAWAADPIPLDIKTGQWEYTVTTQMSGLPQAAKQMPQIPPETLAKMPPDQRAKVEAALKQAGAMASGQPTTNTSKNCIKKEDLAKLNPGGDDRTCKVTVVNSSRSKLDLKMDCDTNGTKSTSTGSVEAPSSESLKFNFQMASTMNGTPMNMSINGTGKWLSSTCTETK